MTDYVEDIMASMQDEEGTIQGLVEVGALTEVGAEAIRQARGNRRMGGRLPSPPFAKTAPSTERRAPAGFIEDGTGAFFFTLAAAVGATTTMRSKVSRAAHVDRLLIIPSAPGAVIDSIKIGDETQELASGAPVELYSAAALTDRLPDNFSPIGPALDMIVTLRNTTAVAITGTIGFKAGVKR